MVKRQKQRLTYKTRTMNISFQPGSDKDERIERKVKVQAPPFTESTYDAGFEVLRELGTTAYGVYMAIQSYRNTKTNDCHPSIKRISEDFNISERTIKDSIDKLYKSGFLRINSGHKNIANNYYFPREFFYHAWDDDYNQINAKRRDKGISEERKTKAEILAENEALRKQLEELQNGSNKYNSKNSFSNISDDVMNLILGEDN